jgi:hypothetical protein
MTIDESAASHPETKAGPTNATMNPYAGITPSPAPARTVSRRELTFGAAGIALGLIAGAAASLLIGLLTSGIASLAPNDVIAGAAKSCDVEANSWIVVGDEGQSISMQSEGAEAAGADYADILCILDALDVPDSVLSRIDSTRALDGRQEGAWNELSASWGYHPDNGLDIVIDASVK